MPKLHEHKIVPDQVRRVRHFLPDLHREFVHGEEVEGGVLVEDFDDVVELGQQDYFLVHGQVVLVTVLYEFLHEL